jgi:hypothetical protein
LYDLEDDWKSVVTSADDLSEKHRQQQTAIWELLSTEIAYIRTLKVITNVSNQLRTAGFSSTTGNYSSHQEIFVVWNLKVNHLVHTLN